MVDIAIFDLYYILVEIIFGSILWAGLAMCVVLIVIGSLLKMSPMMQLYIVGMFAITFGIGYGGSIVAVVAFIFGLIYFFVGAINALFAKSFA